ncbi:hypothetical protein Tco_0767517 [Tanacetum coccineum]
MNERECNIKHKWVKDQDNPLIPNTHPLKAPITVLSSTQLKKTHKPRKAKRITKISQSSEPIHLVADEIVYKEWEDRMERAATTASSLEAEQYSGSGPRCQVTILGGVDAQTSHIKYALTESPTIYVSLIEQFWQTVTACTLEDEDMGITATINGKVKVASEASIIRHLKLEDSDGISTLPNVDLF